jgi:adenosylcobinamide-GDP ribazoletransferase
MKGFLVALQFLTRLPGPRLDVSGEEFAASMRWFPAVGLVVGGIVAVGAWLGAEVDSWVGALFALLLWVGVTGALHIDGLGDVADAVGAAHKGPERIRAVLSDPHIGSFGATAIGLQLLAKIVLLHALVEARLFLPLLLVPAVARIGPLVWARSLPPLHDGLGARFRDAVGIGTLGLWGAALLAAAIFVPALLAAILFIPLWAAWLKNRIGGISGDGHGAGIEVTETALLIAVSIGGRIV